MQLAPPVHVRIDRFSRWTLAVTALASLSAAVVVTWLVDAWLNGDTSFITFLAVALGSAAALCLGLRASRVRPFELRWDGQCWWHRVDDAGLAPPVPGGLSVAIDLGSWLLLTFEPHGTTTRRNPRTLWLPVQSPARSAAWHGLRCAVYSPRPSRAHLSSTTINAASSDLTS